LTRCELERVEYSPEAERLAIAVIAEDADLALERPFQKKIPQTRTEADLENQPQSK
jgi:hypothetical protein